MLSRLRPQQADFINIMRIHPLKTLGVLHRPPWVPIIATRPPPALTLRMPSGNPFLFLSLSLFRNLFVLIFPSHFFCTHFFPSFLPLSLPPPHPYLVFLSPSLPFSLFLPPPRSFSFFFSISSVQNSIPTLTVRTRVVLHM